MEPSALVPPIALSPANIIDHVAPIPIRLDEPDTELKQANARRRYARSDRYGVAVCQKQRRWRNASSRTKTSACVGRFSGGGDVLSRRIFSKIHYGRRR